MVKLILMGGLWSLCSEVSIKIDRRIVDRKKLLRAAFSEGCGTRQMLSLDDSEAWPIEDW